MHTARKWHFFYGKPFRARLPISAPSSAVHCALSSSGRGHGSSGWADCGEWKGRAGGRGAGAGQARSTPVPWGRHSSSTASRCRSLRMYAAGRQAWRRTWLRQVVAHQPAAPSDRHAYFIYYYSLGRCSWCTPKNFAPGVTAPRLRHWYHWVQNHLPRQLSPSRGPRANHEEGPATAESGPDCPRASEPLGCLCCHFSLVIS